MEHSHAYRPQAKGHFAEDVPAMDVVPARPAGLSTPVAPKSAVQVSELLRGVDVSPQARVRAHPCWLFTAVCARVACVPARPRSLCRARAWITPPATSPPPRRTSSLPGSRSTCLRRAESILLWMWRQGRRRMRPRRRRRRRRQDLPHLLAPLHGPRRRPLPPKRRQRNLLRCV